MIFRRLTLFLTILFVIPFAKSASGDSKPEAKAQTEHAFIYKVIKTFELTPPVEMDSLQFKYPLAKKELQGQTTFDLSTDPN